MQKRILYTNSDGGVSIIIPAPAARGRVLVSHPVVEEVGGKMVEVKPAMYRDEADDELAVRIAEKDVPTGASFDIVDVDDIPSDRTFRNAWEKNGKAIGVNMPKAKNIAHEKRRAARSKELAPLDIEVTIPAKAQQAEAERQKIRDKYVAMQTAIDASTTPEQLKSVIAGL